MAKLPRAQTALRECMSPLSAAIAISSQATVLAYHENLFSGHEIAKLLSICKKKLFYCTELLHTLYVPQLGHPRKLYIKGIKIPTKNRYYRVKKRQRALDTTDGLVRQLQYWHHGGGEWT